jgi:hypothetical protein
MAFRELILACRIFRLIILQVAPQLAVKNTKQGGYVDIEDHFDIQNHMTLPNDFRIDIPEVNEDEYVDISQVGKSSPESLFQY